MAKRAKSKTASRYTPLEITLLVAKFTLIKLGSLPFETLKFASNKIQATIEQAKGGFIIRRGDGEEGSSARSRSERSRARMHDGKPSRQDPKKLLPKIQFPTITLPTLRFHKKRGRPAKPLTLSLVKKKAKARFKAIPLRSRVLLLLGIFLTIFFYYTFLIFQTAYELPNPSRLASLDKPLTTEFYDRNGKLLYRAYEGTNRTLITLQDLPAYVPEATIAIEDKNFYHHLGIDPLAIIRAIYHNLHDHKLEGASTLTQQLIKNTLLSSEKTLNRKIKEIVLAFWTERLYTKDQILSMYLNEAPYGGPAWGIEAASETYFGKPAKELSLAEAAYLAGLPASPTQFSPYGQNPDLAKQRQLQVLRRMQEDGYITKDAEAQASSAPLNINPPTNDLKAPHFVMYVRDLLSDKYGVRTVSQGGLKVYTTLDLNLQQKLEQIVSEEVDKLKPLNVQNGAAMILDAKNGQILAMVGSRGYGYPGFGNYNATLALRQPGSSIKVLTYATAFKKGYTPGNTILDAPVSFRDQWGNNYSPVNYDGTYHGPVSIRTALGSSLNIPAVKLLATVGLDSFLQTSRDLGITTFDQPQNYGLSITLGGADVKLIEMMGVYDTFSQMGSLNKPTGILRVTDSVNNTLEQYQQSSKTVLTPEVAYLITNILSDNNARSMAFGTNSLLNIPGYEVAVKTGTTDNKRDNWTFGYTPDYVVGVWVGNNDNSPMDPHLASGVTGAAPIWNAAMHTLLDNHPVAHFEKPEGIASVKIDGRNDLAIAGNIPKALVSVKTIPDPASNDQKTVFSDSFSSFSTPSATASLKDEKTN